MISAPEMHENHSFPDPYISLIEKGMDNLNQGNFKEAILVFTALLDHEPANTTALLHRAEAYLSVDDNDRARADLMKIIVINPGDPDALAMLSRIHGNASKPVTWYEAERGLLYDANSTWSYFNKGRVLYDRGEFADALPWFEKALVIDENNAVALLFAGSASNELGRHENAIMYLTLAAERDPDNPGIAFELARAYEGKGNSTAAFRYYEEAVSGDPENAWFHYLYGKNLNNATRYNSAIIQLNQSIRLDLCQAEAWYELARAAYTIGDEKTALEAILKASDIEPNTERFRDLRKKIRAASSPMEWSAGEVEGRLQHDRTNGTLWFYLGRIAYEERVYPAAESYLDQARQLTPDHADTWYYLGMTLYELGRYNDAVCAFDRVILLDPGNAWAYYYRGDILQRQGSCRPAMAFLNKAIQIDDTIPWTYFVKGNCLMNSSTWHLAAGEYTASLRLFPCNRWAWFFGGQSYYHDGQYETALAYFERALKFDPGNEEFVRWRADALAAAGHPDEAIFLYNTTSPEAGSYCL